MKKVFSEIFLYLIVGGIATVVEWVCFFVFNSKMGFHYIVATTFAYIISTFSNWLAGKLIMFKQTNKSILYEIISIYAVSIIGLLMNIAIMWVVVDIMNIKEMLAKIAATGIVFIWNFLVRKYFIYRKGI